MCGVSRGTSAANLFNEINLLNFHRYVSSVAYTYVFRSLSKPHITLYLSQRSYARSTRESEQRLLPLSAYNLVFCSQGVYL